MKYVKWVLISLAAALLMVSCSKNEPEAPVKKEPVTLNFGSLDGFTEEDKNDLIKKFPHITINFIALDVKGIDKLIEENKELPDLVYDDGLTLTASPHLWDDMKYDLNPQITASEMDLSKFRPAVLQNVTDSDGAIYALPVIRLIGGLYYNKIVFDKFQVPYPVDGMSWQEVIELSKKFSAPLDGVQYHGLDLFGVTDGLYMMMNQRELKLVDPEEEKSLVTTGEWRELLEQYKVIYDIPANEIEMYPPKPPFFAGSTAMMVGYFGYPIQEGIKNGQDVDVVTLPTTEKGANIGVGSAANILFITKQSKNKEAAFEVLSHLVSEEVQLTYSRNGLGSVLADKEIDKQFGANISELQGKNTSSFFKLEPPAIGLLSKYETPAILVIAETFNRFVLNGIDIDTTIKEMDDNIKIAIRDEKNKEQ